MFFSRALKFASILLSSAVLSGCLYLQLGGGISSATVTVTPLREPTEILQQVDSVSLESWRAWAGDEKWDDLTDQVELLLLGTLNLDMTLYDANSLYLVTAAGGLDYDADGDFSLDSQATTVAGQWHAILTGKQLRKGLVTVLTETLYRDLELNLDELSDEQVTAVLDDNASRLVPDLDQSGSVDYYDVLEWSYQVNANTYLGPPDLIREMAAAIRGAASAAVLRDLSQQILGTLAPEGTVYEINGSIFVTSSTRVDSDVNDPQGRHVDNSGVDRAQDIINPLELGGYVNTPESGEAGTSFTPGDLDDYYKVDLLAGQLITLVIADNTDINDLDLFLYDSSEALIDASLGLSEFEQLTAPASGTYYIAVSAFSGASNYRLTVGIGDLPVNGERLLLSSNFVPGEIIARFRKGQRKVDSMDKRARFTGMRVRGGLHRANLLKMPAQVQGALPRQKRKLKTLLALKRLRGQPAVRSAELNYHIQAAAIPNDPYYRQQSWHYEMINLPAAWEQTQGDNTIVAVVDTGVLLDHPDMQGQLVAGYDFVSSTGISGDGDGLDDDPNDPGDSTGSTRSSFHGTHVAGTIAAGSNNFRGVSGVSWNSKIMPLRVLGSGDGGSSYDVLQAVRFAAGLENDSGTLPDRPVDIINLSLSGGGYSSAGQDLYNEVTARGIIVVAAAGNDSTEAFAYPAAYDNVISVSAVNINRELASYSNYGTRVDVTAPGGDGATRDVNGDGVADLILSTSGDDSVFPTQTTYALLQGTSMATPHVAGVAALMKSVYPELTAALFQDALEQGLLTDDLGTAGRDNFFGYGLINANKSVLAAQSMASGEAISDRPIISASASALNFGTIASVLPLSVYNGGTGELVISAITPSDNWLSLQALEVNSTGLGSYEVTVDRSQLPIGSYRSTIVISSNAGESVIQVILQQPDPNTPATGDAGLHYVLLVNAATGEIERELSLDAEGGEYIYRFTGVPSGSYQIFAGSDADNDFFICDAGEACGAWPVLDGQPAVIQLRQDLNGMDFTSTFNTGIISSSSVGEQRRSLRRSNYRPSN
jgi:serine protease